MRRVSHRRSRSSQGSTGPWEMAEDGFPEWTMRIGLQESLESENVLAASQWETRKKNGNGPSCRRKPLRRRHEEALTTGRGRFGGAVALGSVV